MVDTSKPGYGYRYFLADVGLKVHDYIYDDLSRRVDFQVRYIKYHTMHTMCYHFVISRGCRRVDEINKGNYQTTLEAGI